MSENAKTIAFVAIGLVAIALGLATRPAAPELDVNTLVGKNLTEAFDSPEEAKRLNIVRFDGDTGELHKFEVAEQNGLWTIPSKDGYPADAAKQMAEAATSLMDRKILQVASNSASDHEQYGVVDPLSPKLDSGQKGVGTRVTMSDAAGKPLADLIVGKSVKDAEGQRYVREAGRDVVYIIEIDPAKLSTNFENWIEKDLLKLNAWDLQQVEIKDYSAELQPVMTRDGRFGFRLAEDPRTQMTFVYDENSPEAQWSAVSLKNFDPKAGENGSYVDFKLAEDEELNDKALNDLKTALDDLKIVDVVRKPAGLSKDLKAGDDFMKNEDALKDLAQRGFTAVPAAEGGEPEIVSSDGEAIVTMKDGVQYVLRFGNLTSAGSGPQAAEAGKDGEATTKQTGDDVNRYLFVMARFNKDAVKRPETKPLPELPAPAAEATKPETPAATPEGTPAATPEATPAESAEEAPKKGAAEAAAADATKAEEAKKDDDAEQPAAKAAEAEKPADADVEKIIAERKQIEQENQRLLDEYNARLKKGEETMKDLNLRFGDWYFVVNDSVFRKIRLGRNDAIKKKETPAEGAAADPAAPAPGGAIPGLPQIRGVNP